MQSPTLASIDRTASTPIGGREILVGWAVIMNRHLDIELFHRALDQR